MRVRVPELIYNRVEQKIPPLIAQRNGQVLEDIHVGSVSDVIHTDGQILFPEIVDGSDSNVYNYSVQNDNVVVASLSWFICQDRRQFGQENDVFPGPQVLV